MTVHACLGGRNICECRRLDRRVAISTVDPHISHVMSVTEGNRLLPGDVGLRGPRRSAPRAEKPQQEAQKEHSSEDTHLRKRIRAAMKDLGHTGRSTRSSERELQPCSPVPLLL